MVQTNLLFLRRKSCYWCLSSLQIRRPRPGLNLRTRFWVKFPILDVVGHVFRSNFLQASRQHLNLEGDCFLHVVKLLRKRMKKNCPRRSSWPMMELVQAEKSQVSGFISEVDAFWMCMCVRVCVGGGGSASASEELACYWIFPITQSTCLQYWRHS
jgi:hypothetical protein